MTINFLTTFDNPFSPITQFTNWFQYDAINGYNCCGLIERMANVRPSMTDDERTMAINAAIDQIVLNDLTGLYKKVSLEVTETDYEDDESEED